MADNSGNDFVLHSSIHNNTVYFNNSTSTKNVHHGDSGSGLMWIALWFVGSLICYSFKPPLSEEGLREVQIERRRRNARRVTPKIPPSEVRKRLIEASLITKRVIACDSDLNLTLGDPLEDDNLDIAPSDDTYDDLLEENDEAAACVICLDVFRVGDRVTWAKNHECIHVFHEECVMPWLENPKHNECPSCRRQIIPDRLEDCEKEEVEDQEPESTVFSIMNGFISSARRASQRYSILSSDIESQLDDLDEETAPPPVGIRRVFSDGAPQKPRRNSAHVQGGIVSTIQKRASGTFFNLPQSTRETTPDLHQNASDIPPPLMLRRVQSVDPSVETNYVIESSDSTDPPAQLPVALRRVPSMDLKRSISLKRVRSTDPAQVVQSMSDPDVDFSERGAPPAIPLQRSNSGLTQRRPSDTATLQRSNSCQGPSSTRPPMPRRPSVGGPPKLPPAAGLQRTMSSGSRSGRTGLFSALRGTNSGSYAEITQSDSADGSDASDVEQGLSR